MTKKSESLEREKPLDWSEKDRLQDVFKDQRKGMWNLDYWTKIIVPLFNLKPDSHILDVGCGLGFMGQMLHQFVPEGKIIGIDQDPNLIDLAKKEVAKLNSTTAFEFHVGNVYELPVADACVDLTICHMLLMHLDDPVTGVQEMKRATKRGGSIVAIEPDYQGNAQYNSVFASLNLSLDEEVKLWRYNQMITRGKQNRRLGSNNIGTRIPSLFHKAGLQLIDVRCCDTMSPLIPPYEGQEVLLKRFKTPFDKQIQIFDIDKDFFAGGGSEEEWTEYLAFYKKCSVLMNQQIEEKTFIAISGTPLLVSVAKKI